MTEPEIRHIPGFPGYLVSSEGKVFSIRHPTGQGFNRKIENKVEMGNKADKDGYIRVGLRKNGVQTFIGVHVCVLLAFVGPCPEGMQCRHFPDGDPSNNRLENLQWGTSKENTKDRVTHGTIVIPCYQGAEHPNSKITENKAREIFALKGKLSGRKVAEKFEISSSTVYEIWRKASWKHIHNESKECNK